MEKPDNLNISQMIKVKIRVVSHVDSVYSSDAWQKWQVTSVYFLPKAHSPNLIMSKISAKRSLRKWDDQTYSRILEQNKDTR